MYEYALHIVRLTAATMFCVGVLSACGSESGSAFSPGADQVDAGSGDPGSFGPGTGGGVCKKLTCEAQGIQCGPAGDGCGGIIENCGTCKEGERCGGPNAPSKCVDPTKATGCVPKTCADLGVSCGPAGDGCGGILQCGTCPAGQQCGATGKPSQCVLTTAIAVDGGACVPKTCADYLAEGKNCGKQSDGCGGTTPDCGTCQAPEFCGGSGPSVCGTTTGGTCTKKTCADYPPGTCGPQSDSCGAQTEDCTKCTAPAICGGGGVPSVCGGGSLTLPDGGACVPLTCPQVGKNCGTIADGCGGVLNCGTTCPAGQVCGGAGTPNVCGVPPCTPKTVCDPGLNCGSQADGCGGTISCGAGCNAPAICGGGGTPNVCGGGTVSSSCVPKTCQELGKDCGPVADGCGNLIPCGTCASDKICGAQTPSVCGTPPNSCVPKTACDPGMTCGYQADGCGGLITCGTNNGGCASGSFCGIQSPNVCTAVPCGGPGSDCNANTHCCPLQGQTTGFCGADSKCQSAACVQAGSGCTGNAQCCSGICTNGTCANPPSGGSCAITGNACGVGNQNGANATCCSGLCQNGRCSDGVTCRAKFDSCFDDLQCCSENCVKAPGQQAGYCGDPRGTTTYCGIETTVCGNSCVDTKTDNNHCGGCNKPCPMGQGCVNAICRAATAVGAGPGNCTSGGPPINLGGGSGTDQCSGNVATKTFTWALCSCKDVKLSGYALIDGFDSTKGPYAPGQLGAGLGYNDGFFTSSSFDIWGTMWGGGTAGFQTNSNATVKFELHSNGNIKTTAASFPVSEESWVNGTVDGKFAFAETLHMPTGLSPTGGATYGTLVNNAPVTVRKPCACEPSDILPVASWVDARATTNDNATIGLNAALLDQPANHTRLDLPCGSYYLSKIQNGNAVTIVTHGKTALYIGGDIINAAPLTIVPSPGSELDIVVKGIIKAGAQLRLGATGYPAATRVYVGGTGQVLLAADTLLGSNLYAPNATVSWSSATDAFGAVFAGNFTSNSEFRIHYDRAIIESSDSCPPPPGTCGSCRDCNNQACVNGSCGMCTSSSQCCPPLVCDTVTGACITPQPIVINCTPKTCAADYPGMCGIQSDGCGQTINCGGCTLPATCGGGGTPSVCGVPPCTKRTCPQQSATCGTVPDGCGGTMNCGDCPLGESCGGGGVAYQCGAPTCTPISCAQQGLACGQTGDGCGATLSCGSCPLGQTCGGGGVPGQCGAPACTPITQCPPGKNCGTYPNGCGGSISCGDCPADQTCGGGGSPNVCGAASCSPKTCTSAGAQCGGASDGCGNVLDCGPCAEGLVCQSNVCVVPTCFPTTCSAKGVQCGSLGDGCGGHLDCGSCPEGQACGGAGVPGVCGVNPCVPKTCQELGAQCGQVANGCGALTADCGTCSGNTTCQNGVCIPACTPITCAAAGKNCGIIADGCGSSVECGPCPDGQTCGGGGTPNVCGGLAQPK